MSKLEESKLNISVGGILPDSLVTIVSVPSFGTDALRQPINTPKGKCPMKSFIEMMSLLTLVDNFTRESLAIEVDSHLGGHRVVEVLQSLRGTKGSKTIRVDNGPEFISK